MAKKAKRATPAPTPEITEEMLSTMHDVHSWQDTRYNPMARRSSFDSDEEYKNYLINACIEMRRAQFSRIVKLEAFKMYNLASDGQRVTGITDHPDNNLAWTSYRAYINAAKTPEERQRRRDQVEASALGRTMTFGQICTGTTLTGQHCCAVTAVSLAAQINSKMGYDDLVVPKSRNGKAGNTDNFVAAAYIGKMSSVQEQIKIYQKRHPRSEWEGEYPKLSYPSKEGSFNLPQAIKAGELNVGDTFALKAQNENSTTGHAMTIVDINRETGEYIIAGMNPHEMLSFNYNSPGGDWHEKYKVCSAIKTSAFMEFNFADEAENLKGLSIDELEAYYNKQKEAVLDLGDDLNAEELAFFTQQKYKDMKPKYANQCAQFYLAQYDGIQHDYQLYQMELLAANDPIRDELILEEPEVYGRRAPEGEETELPADREAVRAGFEKMDEQQWSQMVDDYMKSSRSTEGLSETLKQQAAEAGQRFEATLQSLFADNGDEISVKESMQRGAELFAQYMKEGDIKDKSLDGFIKFLETAQQPETTERQSETVKTADGRSVSLSAAQLLLGSGGR